MSGNDTFGVVLPAAGSGSRFGGSGGGRDKLMMDIGGRSVLQRAVGLFAKRADVTRIVIVTGPERFEVYREALRPVVAEPRLAFVAGGRERWESVLFGLRYLAGMPVGGGTPTFVAVHDAARPLTPTEVIEAAFDTARRHHAALPCVPEPATLKRAAADNSVAETVDRRGLYQAQTPQCFDLASLLAGYEKLLAGEGAGGGSKALADLTDDAQVFERMGQKVAITPGDALNIKITTVGDLALARAIAAAASANSL